MMATPSIFPRAASAVLAVASLFFSTSGPAHAQDTPLGTKAGAFGSWVVYKKVNPMNDAVDCTGVNLASPGIQLGNDGLYLRMTGGISSVQLRFGDEPAMPMRMPTVMEKQVSAIIIEGYEFQKALTVNRLRYSSLRVLRGINEGDVSLNGISEAQQFIAGDCKKP